MSPAGRLARRAAPWVALLVAGCARPLPGPARAAGPAPVDDAKRIATFTHLEDEALSWIAAADPRLAARASTPAPPTDDVLKQIGTEAVLAEDATAVIHGGSLDLFAFRARSSALEQASHRVAAFGDPLPDGGSLGGALARPKLERELLARIIQEEQVRAEEEAKLGDASGDLVRAIVATWTLPAVPEEWPLRDAWVSKHLLEIRDSLRQGRPRTGPLDLDVELYPLERLLAPLQFPRGSAAIAELRVGLDQDMRAVPTLVVPERVAFGVKVHLGVAVDTGSLAARFAQTTARLHDLAVAALESSGPGRAAIEARARQLLLVERPCPAVPGTRVRSMGPPPERAAICGILRALMEEPVQAAALVALHDDVLLAAAAVTSNPPPRTGLLSHPEDDMVDALRRAARERPVPAIGVGLAAELLYGTPGSDARLRAWRELGEAPLDVVARETADAR
ncbi:MAG TPA: hypothetical protein VK762_20090 [Polyangiaceae bacterium]|nr:hypothetical protein [Polyangiaceae bacterium]